ncbi:MAG TPA: Ig-like domain-containing protein, partial [Iamia sp.]|nr:Ig-like domain-containing protein [Iamia sp.]
ELEAAMQASAVDIEEPGVDPTTGPGITMAPALMAEIGAEPRATLVAEGRTLVEVAGDGDDAYEPGEVFDLTQTLRNQGAVLATAVSATLTSASSDATVLSGSASYDTIAPDATAEPTSAFRVRIDRECQCGAQLPFTVTATYTGGAQPTLTETFDLSVGQRAAPSTVPYGGPSQPIPDNGSAGVSTTVAVGDIGAVADITLTIGGSACSTTDGSATVGIAHPFVGDLTLTLTSPSGTTVTLADQSGGSGNNLCQTVFSDAGETAFSAVTSADAPFTGTFRPLAPLSAFAGEDAAGDWTLTAIDGFRADIGTLHAFSLEVTPFSCDVHNSAPTATADAYDTAYETPLSVEAPGVLGNDADADDDTLTATLVEDVEHGTLALEPDGSLVYTPDDGFSGDDTFTYTASDGALATAATTVTITVDPKPNGAPEALADAYETPFETAYVAEAPGVLGNDTDEDDDPLTATLGDDVGHGTLSLDTDGSFTYTPADGFSGEDSFTYTAGDGELSSAPVTVTVTVGPDPNAAPAAVPDAYGVLFDSVFAAAVPGVLGNDTDADGDTLTAAVVDDVDHGILTLVADGSFTYTPEEGFTGDDTFTYTAHDGTLSSAAATVTLTVTRSTDEFVDALYRDFLGRPAEAAGLAFWGDRLLDGLDSRGAVARKVSRSAEYAGIIVRRAYLSYLGRPGDPAGLAYWAERVRTGLPVSELPIHLMGSAEFAVRAGGTPGGFVDALFQSVLGRAPTAGERADRVAALAGGTSRATLARTLYATVSSRRIRVAAQFDLLLDRAPTLTERDLWVGRLATEDDRDLAVALAATDEYLARAEA